MLARGFCALTLMFVSLPLLVLPAKAGQSNAGEQSAASKSRGTAVLLDRSGQGTVFGSVEPTSDEIAAYVRAVEWRAQQRRDRCRAAKKDGLSAACGLMLEPSSLAPLAPQQPL